MKERMREADCPDNRTLAVYAPDRVGWQTTAQDHPDGRTLIDLLVLLIIVLIILSVAGAAFVSPLVLVLLIVALLLFVGPYRGRRGRL
jgi:4-hydroxybenzoate polyprenyltransferase